MDSLRWHADKREVGRGGLTLLNSRLCCCCCCCVGVIPVGLDDVSVEARSFHSIAYCSVFDSRGMATLVPAACSELFPFAPNRHDAIQVVLPDSHRWLVVHGGRLVEEAGLIVQRSSLDTRPIVVSATAGRTNHIESSFRSAPADMAYVELADLERLRDDIDKGMERRKKSKPDMERELEVRAQPGYFHIVPAMKSILEDDWPTEQNQKLFIAIPRVTIEAELTELLLLESLVEEAAAGDEQAQLLIQHIEEECGAPIAEVISAQRSKLEIMLEDQRQQLLIHAAAVERLEQRGRLLKGAASTSASSIVASSSVAASSSSSSSAAPFMAASGVVSAADSTALADRSASSSSALQPPAYSWTQRAEFQSVESLRSPGRKKYGTITKAALRFLHSLKPVRVNMSGGSHLVFHYQSGAPVTLVTPHAGGSKDSTKSSSYCTRLYATLHEAALQQFNPTAAISAAGSSSAPALLQ